MRKWASDHTKQSGSQSYDWILRNIDFSSMYFLWSTSFGCPNSFPRLLSNCKFFDGWSIVNSDIEMLSTSWLNFILVSDSDQVSQTISSSMSQFVLNKYCFLFHVSDFHIFVRSNISLLITFSFAHFYFLRLHITADSLLLNWRCILLKKHRPFRGLRSFLVRLLMI